MTIYSKMANRTLKKGRTMSRGSSKYSESEIILKFIQILNIIKIYMICSTYKQNYGIAILT